MNLSSSLLSVERLELEISQLQRSALTTSICCIVYVLPNQLLADIMKDSTEKRLSLAFKIIFLLIIHSIFQLFGDDFNFFFNPA